MRIDTMLRWMCALILVVVAACSSDEPSPSDDAADSPAVEDSGSDEEPSEPGEPLFAGLDGTVTLLTDTAGGGTRPLLEWDAVDDADHYSAYLYAPSGDVYWVWTGRETSVHVGGEPRLNDDAPGPSVADDMTWAVIAHDATGVPVAVSEQRSIAP